MNLSTLAIALGLGFGLPQIYGIARPAEFITAVRKFPRSQSLGFVLMLLGTAWFAWNVKQEAISDFAAFKPFLIGGFVFVGVGSCFYVKDFLAVRGLAVVLLLLAKLMVDTARWEETPWRVVISAWAYVLILAGIWFTISPWRMRDLLNWGTANESRVRIACAVRLAFCLFVAALGFTVYR